LQKYRCAVIQGSSGIEGFLLALKTVPDLIVTDYDMDQGSGNYLLGRVKSTRSTRHIPVIVYTSTPLEKGLEHAIHRDLIGRGQASAFIARPPSLPKCANISPCPLRAERRQAKIALCSGHDAKAAGEARVPDGIVRSPHFQPEDRPRPPLTHIPHAAMR